MKSNIFYKHNLSKLTESIFVYYLHIYKHSISPHINGIIRMNHRFKKLKIFEIVEYF